MCLSMRNRVLPSALDPAPVLSGLKLRWICPVGRRGCAGFYACALRVWGEVVAGRPLVRRVPKIVTRSLAFYPAI